MCIQFKFLKKNVKIQKPFYFDVKHHNRKGEQERKRMCQNAFESRMTSDHHRLSSHFKLQSQGHLLG